MSDLMAFSMCLVLILSVVVILTMLGVVVEWRRELGKSRKLIEHLYYHLWDADETVPQIRKRKLADLQRHIENYMR